MKLDAYLYTSRHGIFYFRWPLPRSCPYDPRQTLRLSLGTRCPSEAGMLARLLSACGVKIEHHIRQAHMDHATLRAKVRNYFRAQIEASKKRVDATGPLTDQHKEDFKTSLSLLEAGNSEFWHVLGSDNSRAELDKFFEVTGLPRDQYRNHIPTVLDEIRKARIGAHKAVVEYAERLEGYDFSGAVSAPASGFGDHCAAEAYPSISAAVEAFFREHEKTAGWTAGTIQKRRAVLDIAVEWFGAETPMSDLGKRDAAELKEALLSLPTNRLKVASLQGLSLREAIAVPHVPRISNATVNAYLSAFRLFWDWAERHDYAPEALFKGMAVGKKSKGTKDRKPFTQDALETAYNALTDPHSRFHAKTSHRWATLIAMFSGARLNEVCQLQVNDITPIDGIWVFDFNDKGDAAKRLKSSAATRRVPVHSHLIELGLLELREKNDAAGHAQMFPDYGYHPKHGYGDQLSKWFNRTFTKTLGIKSDAHVFHGLRHTFATRLGQADVPTERIQFVIGHEREGVTHQVYMKEGYTLSQTREAIERFGIKVSE